MRTKKTVCAGLFSVAAFLAFAMLTQSCAEEGPRRNHLNYFSSVNHISLSSGGHHLVFTGCGHRNYPDCTIYRYDRKEEALYRYVDGNHGIHVMNSQYWSDSDQFLFFTLPEASYRKKPWTVCRSPL